MKYRSLLNSNIMSIVVTILIILSGCPSVKEEKKPNIVYIMIDDLGYGDLGCYNENFKFSPNIDHLAENGIMFTDFHSNGPICTPTRVSFTTGRYPSRFGERFESSMGYNEGLPPDTYTVADAMRDAGYATAIYGKWHMGAEPPFLPPSYGYDDYVGLATGDGDHHTHIARAGHKDWWKNDSLRMEKGYSTDLITEHSINFIKQNSSRPFFLYVSHLAIHFPWQGPNDPPHRVEGTNYGEGGNKFGIIPNPGNVRPHIQEMIKRVDRGVGEIINTLKSKNLEDNTLVVITSDNGGYVNYSDKYFNISSNGPFRGQKGQMHEGGHRVPCILYWPGKIKAGQQSSELVMTMDMFPTFTDVARVKVPEDLDLDGISILPHLMEGTTLPDRVVGWKKRDVSAIRKDSWKFCMIKGEKELYNLESDIGEQDNLYVSQPEKAKEMELLHESWINDVVANNL